MKTVIQIRDGIVGNVLVILMLLSLSAVAWLGCGSKLIAIPFCAVWIGSSFIFIRKIIKPEAGVLAIEGNKLIWLVRKSGTSEMTRGSLPLQSLRQLEFVLPKFALEKNTKDYTLAELSLIDVHGTRHKLPMELWPGVHKAKIVAALRPELHDLEIVERLA